MKMIASTIMAEAIFFISQMTTIVWTEGLIFPSSSYTGSADGDWQPEMALPAGSAASPLAAEDLILGDGRRALTT